MQNQQVDLTQLTVAPLLHWLEAFGAYVHERTSQNTVQAYLQDVQHFARFFERVNGQVFSPDALNATDVKAYFRWQDDDVSVAVNSRNRRLSSLRVLVRWAVEACLLEYDPTVSIKRKAVELTPRDRSEAEMGKLEAVVRDGLHIRCAGDRHAWLAMRDRFLWSVFLYTGFRIHEVARLNVSNLDFQTNRITIIGKGDKKAVIDVSSEFMNLAASWLDLDPHPALPQTEGRNLGEDRPLITDWNGERLTTGQIRRRIKMIGEAAGIQDLKPHDLRHTYAFRAMDTALAMGMNQFHAKNFVRKQLRHGDGKTTELYFGVRESQVRAVVEAM